MSIVFGVALSLIITDKLISLNTYNNAMKDEINKELTIVR